MAGFNAAHACLCLGIFFSILATCRGGRGLRGDTKASIVDADRGWLVELAEMYTRSNGQRRLGQLEKDASVMFHALPKDASGGLSHDVVRYALHRLFVRRHSWYVRGLEGDQDISMISGAARDAARKVNFDLNAVPVLPALLQKSVEDHHAGKDAFLRAGGNHHVGSASAGLSLRELAALAASIEDLTHKEALSNLAMAYEAMRLDQSKMLSPEQARDIIDTFFTIYFWGHLFDDWKPESIASEMEGLRSSERWLEVGVWLRDFVDNITKESFPDQREFSVTNISTIVEAIGDNYGSFNNRECMAMKSELLSMEGRKPGRVRLSDFYNRSRSGAWNFREKIDYLRTLGALDESNVSNPMVIVTNYVTSPPQCLRSSSVYHLCCPNECEDIMSQLEDAAGGPTASPAAVVKLVAKHSTDTSKPREQLSETLLNRISEIAADHGGQVPLHTRRFALWLHHAFPRECPFPHKEATLSPLTPDEWMRKTGHVSEAASEQEMDEHIRPDGECAFDNSASEVDESLALPWLDYADSIETLKVSAKRTAPNEPTSSEMTVLAKLSVPCVAFAAAIILRIKQQLVLPPVRSKLVV